MLTSNNTYLPITLAASETREIVIEDIVEFLPLFNVKVCVRNIESVAIPVGFASTLEVTDAPMGFTGDWSNDLLDGTVAPSGLLVITVPTIVDGVMTTHTLSLTNPSSSVTARLHLYVNGQYEAVTAQNNETLAIIP